MKQVTVARHRMTSRLLIGLAFMPVALALLLAADLDWPGGSVGRGIAIGAATLGTLFSAAVATIWLQHRGAIIVGGHGWIERRDPWFLPVSTRGPTRLEGDLSAASLIVSAVDEVAGFRRAAGERVEIQANGRSLVATAPSFAPDLEERFEQWLNMQ